MRHSPPSFFHLRDTNFPSLFLSLTSRLRQPQTNSEDATIEAYGILELVCDLLHERARLIASEKECPEDLKSAVVTLIWATNRADVAELHEVKKQFAKKFGKEFVERAEKDEDRLVNERVAHKLSIRPVRAMKGGREGGRGGFVVLFVSLFAGFLVLFKLICNAFTTLPSHPPTHQPTAANVEKYLREIALKNNVDWTPLEQPSDLTEDQKAFSSMPAPTGASVGMGPASGFGHLYSNTGAGGGGGGGGGGGVSMPIARPITPPPSSGSLSISSSGAGGGKEGFQPPSRPPPPLPTQAAPLVPPPPAAAPTAPPSSPPFLPAAVEAEPSAPVVVTAADVEGGGGGGGEGGEEEYDIPLPPTTTPVMPEPEPELPPAPPTSGSGGPGGEVEDLLTRFQRLQQR